MGLRPLHKSRSFDWRLQVSTAFANRRIQNRDAERRHEKQGDHRLDWNSYTHRFSLCGANPGHVPPFLPTIINCGKRILHNGTAAPVCDNQAARDEHVAFRRSENGTNWPGNVRSRESGRRHLIK